MRKTAVIIGAGPAGLTAASELLDRTDIEPVIFEMTSEIGGISKTVEHNGNRIDIGGHRFFSKSKRVMDWWKDALPLQGKPARDDAALRRKIPLSDASDAPDPEKTDSVMLIRNRISRIFFLGRFFDYPVTLKWQTVKNIGFHRVMRIAASYLKVTVWPVKQISSLEDFMISRFGRELYLTFFKDYTEKVWGVPCSSIKPDWGVQRIKGLSVSKTIAHALKSMVSKPASLAQEKTETSLIEQFMYPKLGPGQLWEKVAQKVSDKGGRIHLQHQVVGIEHEGERVRAVVVKDLTTGATRKVECDFLFSSMPVKDLVGAWNPSPPEAVGAVANGLQYRDFITVGLLLNKLKIKNETKLATINDIVPDNWIYVQEREVKLGRLQIFNNWSPYMVKDPDTVWIGLEYFANEGDKLWSMQDADFIQFAIKELEQIKVIDSTDVLDATIIRVPKAYPAYFGTYDQFHTIRSYLDGIGNLFLIGRNGMHRYNNSDHSMMTAMVSVENIVNGVDSKDNIWDVNTEEEYHEEKQPS